MTVVSMEVAVDSSLSSVTQRFLVFCVGAMVELSIEMTRFWNECFLA